ncbi:MAG TPA: hypothetical protein VJ770_29505 [Stellaceae bacterium]|nr:hypothetical protein [Stellaceae bacterium]
MGDFADVIKYDARAGRLFRIDYDPGTKDKEAVDITSPPPSFAIDFGSLEVGYAKYTSQGPSYVMVPVGQPLPEQPAEAERDENAKLTFRPAFRVRLYGKRLDGLREWSSTASCVLEALDDLYQRSQAAPEAAAGQIPVVELTRTIPITSGKGARANTVYAPVLTVVGWTDRVSAMGEQTVPPPTPELKVVASSTKDELDDDIPF